MRKNISSLLQKGNLTPKERYLLIIQNEIEKATTGKEPLTKADIEGLKSWQAKTSEEAREWNKYNGGWQLNGRAGIEAEFIYAETKAEHFRKNIISTELAFYPFYREHLNAIKALKKIKVVDIKEAVEITNKQREQKLKDGLDFDYVVYRLAFESLGKDFQQDLKELFDEVEYDTEYLDSEEIIAGLIDSKGELTKKNKEKLAELVAERSYNEFAKEYQLYHYFGNIPIMEVAKKWAKDKGIKPRKKDYEWLEKIKGKAEKRGTKMKEIYNEIESQSGEKKSDEEWLLEDKLKEILEDYARDNKTTIKKILKETLIKWLEEGLLIDEHTPLFNSDEKNTYGKDTKYPHNKIFKEWLKSKTKAEQTLKKLIDKGKLKVELIGVKEKIDTASELKNISFSSYLEKENTSDYIVSITGESLYNFKGDYKFVKDFKERIDKYEPNLGIVYADEDNDPADAYLDRELLIAKKDKDGKPAIISIFGMSLRKIEGTLSPHYFKEIDKDGETYLEFKSEDIEKAFKDTRQSLIDGYAILLAFQEIHKKLSKIYEIDLTFLITPKVEQVSDFIETHNEFLERALKDITGFGVGFGLYKKPLKTREDLYINKEKIAPDTNTTEEYGKKFYEILGDEYKY